MKRVAKPGRNGSFVLLVILSCLVLFALPTGFEREINGEAVKVRVLQTENSSVRQHGIIRTGDQLLTVEILSGSRGGEQAEAVNHLFGKLELDKMYVAENIALALLDANSGEINKLTLQDHYRLPVELLLLVLFSMFLLGYAGFTGARALLSLFFSALVIWKVLLPGFLRGWDPVLTSLTITALLCLVVILLVGGLNRKSAVAVGGSIAGMAFTCGLSVLFAHLFQIHGAVKPFSETLLYSGFGNLDLTRIFMGGIFLASSGAVMDLAMDISSSMHEIRQKSPSLSRLELIRSGHTIGRIVLGTMTTTLLLAYTGSFCSMLMVFIAQGTPVLNVLNIQYVAAELLHTLVGSLGLVAVAPLTVFLGGILFPAQIEKGDALPELAKSVVVGPAPRLLNHAQ